MTHARNDSVTTPRSSAVTAIERPFDLYNDTASVLNSAGYGVPLPSAGQTDAITHAHLTNRPPYQVAGTELHPPGSYEVSYVSLAPWRPWTCIGYRRGWMNDGAEWVIDPGRFAQLRQPWEALTEEEPTPFCDHEWFSCWWDAFGSKSAMSVCAVWRRGDLVAALPLVRDGTRLVAMANFHTPVFHPPARDVEALRAALDAVLERRPSELTLPAIPVGDGSTGVFAEISRRHSRISLVERMHSSPIVELPDDFDSYERMLPSSLRTLKRRRRKLHREHSAEFQLDESSRDLDADLDRGFQVEASGWKARTGTAILASPATACFYRGVAHAYRARGELRLAWLLIDGRPAAFAMCLARHRRLYLIKTGFDESFGKFTPGLVLQLSLIERCFELGLEAYDLLGGDEAWKRQFATGRRDHIRIRSYRRGPLPLARYAARRTAVPVLRQGYSYLRALRRARLRRPRHHGRSGA